MGKCPTERERGRHLPHGRQTTSAPRLGALIVDADRRAKRDHRTPITPAFQTEVVLRAQRGLT